MNPRVRTFIGWSLVAIIGLSVVIIPWEDLDTRRLFGGVRRARITVRRGIAGVLRRIALWIDVPTWEERGREALPRDYDPRYDPSDRSDRPYGQPQYQYDQDDDDDDRDDTRYRRRRRQRRIDRDETPADRRARRRLESYERVRRRTLETFDELSETNSTPEGRRDRRRRGVP
ncbi:MAG: hypothetical protein AAF449_03640 [Myxococcota bacterium]